MTSSVPSDFLSDFNRSEFPSTSGLIPHLRLFLDFNFCFPSLCQYILLRTFTSSLPPLDSSGGFAETTSGTIVPSGLSAITSSVLRPNSPEFSGSFRLQFSVPDSTDDNGHSSGELPTSEIYFALAARPIHLGLDVSGITLDLCHFPKFPALARCPL
ncbi:hypothetical protein K438DRAFT_1993910 [Mycena galopus ATCC 62051]|nr:hypothetical protein K438DRAFT_1993910 [Mycena galopus ATCC 62051]